MQTKREYLVDKGLAKPGRGKFSNAAKDELARAMAAGVKFSDSTAPAAPVRSKDTRPPVAPEPVAPDPRDSLYISPSDFRFPEGEYVAVSRDSNGKKVLHSVREVCNTCMVSLTNHACASPTIYGNVPVVMERR